MKKAIIENTFRFICPHCGETRTIMMVISKGKFPGCSITYSNPGDTILCVSCNKEFVR